MTAREYLNHLIDLLIEYPEVAKWKVTTVYGPLNERFPFFVYHTMGELILEIQHNKTAEGDSE